MLIPLAQEIAKTSGILKEMRTDKDKGPEEVERYQNVEELLAGIKEFTASRQEGESKSLSEFMLDVALLTDADEDKGDERNHITLMTIHSSKGLEFPHVYLVGLEENLFPSQMALHSRTELEEETPFVLRSRNASQRNVYTFVRHFALPMGKSYHLGAEPFYR